ncbi:rCG58049, partial [Rattus norvegicus]
MFETDTEDDMNIDDLDVDDLEDELEIHNIYKSDSENCLSSDDSLHSYEFVT